MEKFDDIDDVIIGEDITDDTIKSIHAKLGNMVNKVRTFEVEDIKPVGVQIDTLTHQIETARKQKQELLGMFLKKNCR